MSTKNAGEDFYFLQKIAKVGKIRKISTAKVYPSSRVSDRVIFGTGPKIKEYIKFPEKRLDFYNIQSFEILRRWIETLDNPLSTPELMLKKAEEVSPELANFLVTNKFLEKTVPIYEDTRDKFYLSWRLHEWFDGLKTLRLIHWLRDRAYNNINILEASKFLIKHKLEIDIPPDKRYEALEILQFLREGWNYYEEDGTGIKPHLLKLNFDNEM